MMHEDMLILRRWKNVTKALKKYESATNPDLTESNDDLIKSMLSQARVKLRSQASWNKEGEHESTGTTFSRTDFRFEILDRNLHVFALGIGFVGNNDALEIDLAQHLPEVHRGIRHSTVTVRTKLLPNDGFRFDFEEILRRLGKAIDINGLTATDAIKSLSTIKLCGEMAFVISNDCGLIIELSLNQPGSRFGHKGEGKDSWIIDNGTISGNLTEYYECHENRDAPSFRIQILRRAPDLVTNGLIWRAEEMEKVRDLTEKITKAFM
jgi:hypothetical protein